MNRDCFNEIVSLLQPYMDRLETRQAILKAAWYGSSLLNLVNWTGNAYTFTVLAVEAAIDYGEIEKGLPAIHALLEGLRPQVGYDVQEKIDTVIKNCLDTVQNRVVLGELPSANNTRSKKHFFISYASNDRVAFVERLAKDLTERAYKTWVDNLGPEYYGITAGKAWKQELANALNQAQVLIFVLTPDSIRSPWCYAELLRASEQSIPILPILVRPINDDDIQIMSQLKLGAQVLNDLHYRDFVKLGYEKGLDILLDDVEKSIS